MALVSNNTVRVIFLLAMVVCAAHAGKDKEEKGKGKDDDGGGKGGGDITELGAKGDGKTDSTKAVLEAWSKACGKEGPQTVTIPKGDYLVGPLNMSGPCKGKVTIKLEGNLLGTTDLNKYKTNWIEMEYVDNLVWTGKGHIDGQGKAVWDKNSCAKKYDCKVLPNSLVFDFCNNITLDGITVKDSKFFHINVFQTKGVTIKDVTVSAPGDSPNTDGIHMGDSSNITITDTHIGVGDDCISIGPGTQKVNISGVTCGPGHGISIGSLGRYKDEKDVTDITVKNCKLKNATNGIRIKSYEDAACQVKATNFHYENIEMVDAFNPIIIDMKYCPNNICTSKGDASKVTVKDVTFKNITGTSQSPEVVSLLCSDRIPCSEITMEDVKVQYTGKNNKTMTICKNAKGKAKGCMKELDKCF